MTGIHVQLTVSTLVFVVELNLVGILAVVRVVFHCRLGIRTKRRRVINM